MIQSSLAQFFPASLCPDFGLLLVVAIGLCGRSVAGGLLASAFIGFVADLLSGSLMGQHLLLRVLAYAVAKAGCRQVNLKGAGSQFVFVALVTLFDAIVMGGITAFFSPGEGFVSIGGGELFLSAFVNALAAPLVTKLVGILFAHLGDDEGGGRRVMRIETRSWSS
jgi:rod shape-determining protein MreD